MVQSTEPNDEKKFNFDVRLPWRTCWSHYSFSLQFYRYEHKCSTILASELSSFRLIDSHFFLFLLSQLIGVNFVVSVTFFGRYRTDDGAVASGGVRFGFGRLVRDLVTPLWRRVFRRPRYRRGRRRRNRCW